MNGILPPTYVPGFHDDSAVREMRYSRLGRTDMVLSNFGLGGTPFGAEKAVFSPYRMHLLAYFVTYC